MDIAALNTLATEHRQLLLQALAEDAFFVPVKSAIIDRSTGDLQLTYLTTTVPEDGRQCTSLLMFTSVYFWKTLEKEAQGLVQPPLTFLLESIGNVPIVVDLGSKNPFKAELETLVLMRQRLLTIKPTELGKELGIA